MATPWSVTDQHTHMEIKDMCRRGINQLALRHSLGSAWNTLLSRALKRMVHLNKHEACVVS